ncbi:MULTISPECIES: hypothetical protein [Streptomyces]|uniref:hypothetical protein n=1 Tax=Streptomyces TaxID=1883 RepID=UPI0016744574|nr:MULTISPECIES: hypothetical protein [Streptomyces]MBK3521987.1 hypothetical protein [Streptomyces sp. MBT70]GGS09363.1 hypothetical protein GCM10010236_74770 [Streptomyces eurythermus]
MYALLEMPGLDGALDTVRLAVIVLASRTPSETGEVVIRTGELGRWIGLSASRTASSVVPGLRRSGLVEVETEPGEFGQDDALRCRLLPMWKARGMVGHPLNLKKSELATLLRLMEAVMAPGWAHRDGRVTPAGLLGVRTGRGAATDRLALLLLVLEARETGRVRLCGGRVDKRYGRPTATLARLLGCSMSRAERALARLEDAGLVERPRKRTASGLQQESRLVVPAVAAAHSSPHADTGNGDRQAGSGGSDRCVGELADTAGPDKGSLPSAKSQVNGVSGRCGSDEGDLANTADLHTDHPHLVTPVSSSAVSRGFSGEGRGGIRRRPERACVREQRTAEDATSESALPVAKAGPLRGEKPGEVHGGRAKSATAGVRPRWLFAVDERPRRRHRSVADLDDLRLRVALAPAAELWDRLNPRQQAVASQAALQALQEVAEIADDSTAPRLLADRLTDRLEEVGGQALVRDPMGWLLGRGLVQRPACADPRCDDGIRLDTRADCPTCTTVIADRRAQRARLRALADEQLAGAGTAQRRALYEQQLREHALREAARAEARRAREAVAVQARRAGAARRRAQQEAAAQARRSAPCAECGLPDAAGLCPQCTHRQRIQTLLHQAVDLAVAVRADLDDPDNVAQLTEQCAADTKALLAKASRHNDSQPELRSLTEREVADRILAERRTSALRRLLRSEEADAEAETVYEMVLRRHPTAHRAAEEAAEQARHRTAQYLLQQRLGQLRVLRIRAAAGRLPQRTA